MPERPEAASLFGRRIVGRRQGRQPLVPPALEHEHALRDLDGALDILLDLGEEVAQGAVEAGDAAATAAAVLGRARLEHRVGLELRYRAEHPGEEAARLRLVEADGGDGEVKLRLQRSRRAGRALLGRVLVWGGGRGG